MFNIYYPVKSLFSFPQQNMVIIFCINFADKDSIDTYSILILSLYFLKTYLVHYTTPSLSYCWLLRVGVITINIDTQSETRTETELK